MANLNLNFYDKSGNPLNFEYIGPTGPSPLDLKFTYKTAVGSTNPGDLDIVNSSGTYEFRFNPLDLNLYNITEWSEIVDDWTNQGASVYLNGNVAGGQSFKFKIQDVVPTIYGFSVYCLDSDYSGQSIISNDNTIYFQTTYEKAPGGYFKGNMYFDPVSTGLYENEQIFIVQEFFNPNADATEYGIPHTTNSDSPNVAKWRTRWYNNNYGETDVTDVIFTYVIEDQIEGGDGQPLIVNYPNIVTQIDKDSADFLQDGIVWTTNVTSAALAINVAVNAPDTADNIYERKLIVEDITTGTPQKVMEIDYYCQIVGEDDRFKVLTENLGRAFYSSDSIILRDHDPEEPHPNFQEINEKRKELMVAGEEIFPYIGSYKGLIGALKFFGYQDLRIKEYWLNLSYKNVKLESPLQQNQSFLNNIKNQQGDGYKQSYTVGDVLDNENSGKYKLTQTYGPDKLGNYVLNVTSENTMLPSKTYKKTSLFGLYYDLNKVTDDIDEFSYPVVVDAFKFTQEEVLIKIFALRERLKRDYLPLNARIIDITGEGVYFMINNTRSWTDVMERSDINIGFDYDFFPNPDFGFIEDLRNFSIRPNASYIQSPSSYNNEYSANVNFVGGTGSAINFSTGLPNGATGSNPTLNLISGQIYNFYINDPSLYGYGLVISKNSNFTPNEPFGIINNGATGGNTLTWYVNPKQTSPLYYYSTGGQSLMNGVINILPSLKSDLGNIIDPLDNIQQFTKEQNNSLLPAIEEFYSLKQNDKIVELGDGRFDPSAYIDPTTGTKYKTPIGMPVILEILVDRWSWNELNIDWTGLTLPTFKVGDRVRIKSRNASLSALLVGGSIVFVDVDDGGLGYNSVPTITVSGGGGVGAILTPVMSGTRIASVNIPFNGTGYTTTPTLTISTNYGDFGEVTNVSYSTGVYTVLLDSTGSTALFETSELYATTQAYFQLNWDNVDFSNIVEIEWILNKSATQPGSPYHFEFRGPILDFYKLAHFLPYTGEYQVICNTYDAFNAKTSVIRNGAIVVEPKTVDIDSWTRYREVEDYIWTNVARGWDDYDSMWEYPAEGETMSKITKSIPSEILDFATYGNKSIDGQDVYVRTATSQVGALGTIELTQNIIYITEIESLQISVGQYGYARVHTMTPHNLVTGDGVTIVGSIPQIDGRWIALVNDDYTFRIQITLEGSWSGVILETFPINRYVIDTTAFTNQRISGAGKIDVFVNGRLIGSAQTGDSLYNTANEITSSINSLRTYPDYFASCTDPEMDPVTITIAAPGSLGAQQNGVPLSVTFDGSLVITAITPYLSGGVSPTENYVYWSEDDLDYPNDNLKYWGTKRLDWEVFTESTWDNGYAHSWFDYEFNNDWLGGYELHTIIPNDNVKISTGNTTFPFPVGVTFASVGGALTLQQVADQLNNSPDPNITNFYYRPIPSDVGSISASSPAPINVNVIHSPLYNGAYPPPPSLIGGSPLLTVNFGYTGGAQITSTTTTTSTTSTTTTTTLAPPPFTTTTTTTTSTTTTTTVAPPDCALTSGSAVYIPPPTTTTTTTTSTTSTTTSTTAPPVNSWIQNNSPVSISGIFSVEVQVGSGTFVSVYTSPTVQTILPGNSLGFYQTYYPGTPIIVHPTAGNSFKVRVSSATGMSTARKLQAFSGSISTLSNFSLASGIWTATIFSSGSQYVIFMEIS